MEDQQSPYKKGYYIDYCRIYESSTYIIENITQNYIEIRDANSRATNPTLDKIILPSKKIKPFRSVTVAKQQHLTSLQRIPKFERELYEFNTKILEELNDVLETGGIQALKNKYTPNDIVQIIKGKIYFSTMRAFALTLKSKEQFQILSCYFKEFLRLVVNYLNNVNLRSVDIKQLYESTQHSFILSYPEIFFNLTQLSLSRFVFIFQQENASLCSIDYFSTLMRTWYNQKFFPVILNKNLNQIFKDILERMIKVIVSVKCMKGFEFNETNFQAVEKVILHALEITNQFTKMQLETIFNSVLETSAAWKKFRSEDSLQKVKIKLKYMILVRKAMNAKNSFEFIQDLRQIMMSKQCDTVIKYISTLPHFEMIINKLCTTFGYDSSCLNYLEYFIKIKKAAPEMTLKNIIKTKKSELFKKLPWTAFELRNIVSYVNQILCFSKEDLIILVQAFRTLMRQRQYLGKYMDRCKKQIQELQNNNKNSEMQNEDLNDKIRQLNSQFAESKKKDLANSELYKDLEIAILSLSEELITSSDYTSVMVQTIQTYIIKQGSPTIKKYMENIIKNPASNVFREAYIISNYLKSAGSQLQKILKLPNRQSETENRSIQINLKETFQTLCENMKSLKTKIILELRKENLKNTLQIFAQLAQHQVCDLICSYLKAIPFIQNKQFKVKYLDFIIELFKKDTLLSKLNEEQKVKVYKKIMETITIQNQISIKLYQCCFIKVNLLQNNMKILEKSIQQILFQEIVINQLYGVDKLFETLRRLNPEKTISRKNILDYLLILAKNTQNEDVLFAFLEKFTSFLLNQIKANNQINPEQQKFQYISQISSYLYQLLNYENENIFSYELTENQHDYQRIQALRAALGQLQLIIHEEGTPNSSTHIMPLKRDFTLGYYKHQVSKQIGFLPVAMDLKIGGEIITSKQFQKKISHYFLQKYHEIVESKKSATTIPNNLEKQKTSVQFTIYPNNKITPVSTQIMNNLNILFLRLPLTDNIWRLLPIHLTTWQRNQNLNVIRQFFLQDHRQLQSEFYLQYWKEVITCDRKKQIMIDILCSAKNLENFNSEELFDFLSPAETTTALKNNQRIIKLLKNIDFECNEENTLRILDILNVSDNSPHEVMKIEKNFQYRKLVDLSTAYLLQNASYDLFQFFIRIKEHYHNDIDQIPSLQKQIVDLWKLLYEKKSYEQKVIFFQTAINEIIFFQPRNFEIFLKILSDDEVIYQNIKLYEMVLTLCINKICQMNQKLKYPTLRILLKTIELLLEKRIKNKILHNQTFIMFLQENLYSNLGTYMVTILGYLIESNPLFLDKYIPFFSKQMNEPLWEHKSIVRLPKRLRNLTGFTGLKNPNSVCYINSLLQQLFFVKQFRYSLFATKWKQHQYQVEDLIYQLKKTFINLEMKQSEVYINEDFFKAFKNQEGQETSIAVQMDVDQFRNILLDRIQNFVIPPESFIQQENQNSRNFVHKIFNGRQSTIIKGCQCNHESKKQEQFTSICLDVKNIPSLSQSLKLYFQPQILEGQNSYNCEQCQKKIKAEKSPYITQYPYYLTFVLKRFQFKQYSRQKINSRFQFPMEQFLISEDIKYQLTGIIIHQGVTEGGHYFSYIKIQGYWYEFNDSFVKSVDEEEVKNVAYGQARQQNKNAYLLIYKKKVQGNELAEALGITIDPEEKQKNHIEGLNREISEIHKSNRLNSKINLIFSVQFEDFLRRICVLKHPSLYSLLFQFITQIKAKKIVGDIGQLQQYFGLLEEVANGEIIKDISHADMALTFYKTSYFSCSLKSALTQKIEKKHVTLTEPLKLLLTNCLSALSQNYDSSPFFKLFLVLARKDKEILKFLVNHLIIARIMNITIPQIIVPIARTDLEEVSQKLKIIQPSTDKKKIDVDQYKYHKWKLCNLCLESDYKLHKIESQLLFDCSNSRKIRLIFSEAISKANINQISKFFCLLSKRKQSFSKFYIDEICQAVWRDKGQNLRKYLKAIGDLLKIEDSLRDYKFKEATNLFAGTLRSFNDQRMFSNFDIVWQWLLKIAAKNEDFRHRLMISQHQFSCILSESPKNCLTIYRPQPGTKYDEKLKHKYHNLKFGITMPQNSQLLKQKIQKTKKMFQIDNRQPLHQSQWDSDEDLTEVQIKRDSYIMKFVPKQGEFVKFKVREICGDQIELDLRFQNKIDKGNDQIARWFYTDDHSSQTDYNNSDNQNYYHAP